MKNQEDRAEDRIIDNDNDYRDMDSIIEKYYESEHDDPTDIADLVLNEISEDVEHRHLRSFSLKEIEGNVVAYMETMEEMKKKKA